jgi:hypothetical protein
MRLSTTLAIYLGFLVESLWLWDAASEKFSKKETDRAKIPGFSTPTMAAGIALVVGAMLIGIAEIAGENTVTEAINNALEFLLMGIAMFFILIAGAVGGWLVPRVNEYSIVSILAVVSLTTLTQKYVTNPLLIGMLIGLPLILSVALALQKSAPAISSKVVLYLLYLGALILLVLQSDIRELSQQTQFTITEAFVFGSTLCYLALHLLLGLRFLVITTSFILPANRIYARPMMQKLFKDDQLAPLPFFFTLIVLLAAVILNQQLALFPADTFAVILVIICTQLLFRSGGKTEIV